MLQAVMRRSHEKFIQQMQLWILALSMPCICRWMNWMHIIVHCKNKSLWYSTTSMQYRVMRSHNCKQVVDNMSRRGFETHFVSYILDISQSLNSQQRPLCHSGLGSLVLHVGTLVQQTVKVLSICHWRASLMLHCEGWSRLEAWNPELQGFF